MLYGQQAICVCIIDDDNDEGGGVLTNELNGSTWHGRILLMLISSSSKSK